LTDNFGTCQASHCKEGSLTFFSNLLSFKCETCDLGFGLDSVFIEIPERAPLIENTDYLSKCRHCDSEIKGAVECAFAGE